MARTVVVVMFGFATLALSRAALSQNLKLTIEEAIARARATHPALASASARRREAVSLARQESAFPNPIVEYRRENFGSPLAPDVFTTIAQPLDVTGRRLALRARVSDVERGSAADSLTVLRDVENAVARAFWRASLAKALMDLAEQQRLDADRLARIEELRAREGDVAEVVAIRTRMESERMRIIESSARAALASATGELARAVGYSVDSLPSIEALSAVSPIISIPLSDSVVVAYAFAHRSELTSTRAANDAAKRRLAAERRGVLSDIAIEVGSKQTAGYSTRLVAVAVSVPLFNRNGAARDRAATELDVVQVDRRTMEHATRTSVVTALRSYHALQDAQPSGADSLVFRAGEVTRIAEGAYAAGGGSLIELLDARRAYSETLTTVLRWIADLRIAHADLLRAMGLSPLDSIEGP